MHERKTLTMSQLEICLPNLACYLSCLSYEGQGANWSNVFGPCEQFLRRLWNMTGGCNLKSASGDGQAAAGNSSGSGGVVTSGSGGGGSSVHHPGGVVAGGNGGGGKKGDYEKLGPRGIHEKQAQAAAAAAGGDGEDDSIKLSPQVS